MDGTQLVQTKHGPMITLDEDPWVSKALRIAGEYSESEIAQVLGILSILQPPGGEGKVFVDGGAFIGDMTIPISRQVDRVYAFEPQPRVRAVLEQNLALNRITNVEVLPYALGHENTYISFDETGTVSDSMSHGPVSQRMNLHELAEGALRVEMRTLDSLDIHPTFLKADIEGMEMLMLVGAKHTIHRYRPVLFLERDTVIMDGAPSFAEVFASLHYCYHACDYIMVPESNYNNAPISELGRLPTTVSKMALGVPMVPLFPVQTKQ